MIKLGYDTNTKDSFSIDVVTFLKTHTFIQAITGGGKTGMILKVIEEMRSEEFKKRYGYVPIIIIDDAGEFLKIPEYYQDFVLLSRDQFSEIYDAEHAFGIGRQTRQLGLSMIVKISDLRTSEGQEEFVGKFVEGTMKVGREHWKPCVLLIDEADIFCPSRSKRKNVFSREPIINACKRARKMNLVLTLATQRLSEVDISARSMCANRIIGKTVEKVDRKDACEMLDDSSIYNPLWSLPVGQFYVRGDALSRDLSLVQVFPTKIKTPEAGISWTPSKTNKTLKDIFTHAVDQKDDEPFVIQQQRQIERLESLRDSNLKKVRETKEQSYAEGYQDGYAKGSKDTREDLEATPQTVNKIRRLMKF